MTSGEVLVRAAGPGDDGAIADTLVRAFARENEAALVRRLTQTGANVVSLVAEAGGVIVGHAMLCRVGARIDGRAVEVLALAPVSVRPTHQRRGIGTRLVNAAFAHAVDAGAEALIAVGDPGFFGRFGFSNGRALVFNNGSTCNTWQAVEIVPGALSGENGSVEHGRVFAEA